MTQPSRRELERMLDLQPAGTHFIFGRGVPLRKDTHGYWRKIRNPGRMTFTSENLVTDIIAGMEYVWTVT